RAAVVRAVEAAVARIHHRVDAIGAAGGEGEADAAGLGGEALSGERRPGRPAVRRLVEAAPRPVRRRIDAPGRTPRLPERGVHHARIAGTEGEVDGAGVLVLEEDLVPAPPAIRRAEDPALGIGTVGMAEGGQEHAVRIARVDQDAADLLRVAETDVRPGAAAIRRLVRAV